MPEPIKDAGFYDRVQRLNDAMNWRRAKQDAAAGTAADEPGGAIVPRDGNSPAGQPPAFIDPARLFAITRGYLTHYARFTSEAQADAVTLWAMHAHVRDAGGVLRWDATPRLMLLSSVPGSGKSRVLELLGWLCPATNGLDTEMSAAALAWTISAEHATVLLDETDILFGAGRRNVAVRAILNSGYRRDGTVLRMRGSKGVRASVFGPIAMAGLDVMATGTGGNLDALMSRAIVVRMRKSDGGVPALDDTGRRDGERIKAGLARWAAEQADALTEPPELPGFLENRQAEIWGPLIACGLNCGGEAHTRALSASRELTQIPDAEIPPAEDAAALMDELEAIASGWDTPAADSAASTPPLAS